MPQFWISLSYFKPFTSNGFLRNNETYKFFKPWTKDNLSVYNIFRIKVNGLNAGASVNVCEGWSSTLVKSWEILLMLVTDVSTTSAAVIFRAKWGMTGQVRVYIWFVTSSLGYCYVLVLFNIKTRDRDIAITTRDRLCESESC